MPAFSPHAFIAFLLQQDFMAFFSVPAFAVAVLSPPPVAKDEPVNAKRAMANANDFIICELFMILYQIYTDGAKKVCYCYRRAALNSALSFTCSNSISAKARSLREDCKPIALEREVPSKAIFLVRLATTACK